MSAPPPSARAGSSSEAQAAAFADDPRYASLFDSSYEPLTTQGVLVDDTRVYYNQETSTWRLEQDEGDEIEYDSKKGSWVPVVDDDLVKQQQAAYSMAGVDEETPAAPVLKRESKKRKVEDYTHAPSVEEAEPSAKRGKANKPERKSKNTAVYVTGLPTDTDPDELIERFSKFGVLEEDDTGEPKIKMYAKEDGTFSGEALIVYFKEDSVILALSLLDEAELRIGDPKTVMRVTQADFKHKNQNNKDGVSQPRKVVDKKAATKRIGKMQKKLYEWGFDDGFGPQPDPSDKPEPPKASRVVVLKHMFTKEELEKDAALLLDLKEDVRDECSSLGDVTNVTLYDKEPDGVMTVKFRDPLSAQACVLRMNGRYFDGRRVIAELFTGKQRFKRSDARDDLEDEDDTEKQRLDEFAEWLMKEGE